MKKKLLLITTFFTMALVILACKKEFLEINPQGSLDENSLANPDGVEAALISAYSMLDGWNHDWGQFGSPWPTAGSNWVWGSVASDDAYKGSESGDQPEITQIELFQWLPGNGYFDFKFKALYEGIARSNATINVANNVTEMDENEKARVIAEARFLRGHYHFDAYKLWKNVPYYTEADEDFRKPNTENILPSIIGDFEAAIANLPEVQNEVGRVNKYTAYAYAGKAYLYDGNFGKARENLKMVVDNPDYQLAPCFWQIFSVPGENGSEMIFSVQASVNDGSVEGENGNFADRLNFPHGGSPFGCCGFHQPTQNLVNAFKVDDDGLPLLDDFNDSNVTIDDFVDPRLDWTVGRDDVPFLNWGKHAPGWIRAREYAGPYSAKKNIYVKDAGEESGIGWQNTQLNALNVHLMRFSDVILMLAEAEVELGALEEARRLVNIVRARAANCAQGIGTDASTITTTLNDTAITWAKYKVEEYTQPWTDPEVARKAVRHERRIELAMEGHRFFDLRRWGIAADVMNEYMRVEGTRRQYLTATNTYVSPKNDVYPLPSIQIELSKKDGVAQLIQNDGY